MFSGVRSISNRMRFGFAALLVIALTLAAPYAASAAVITRAANIVTSLSYSPRTPNFLLPNQQITIGFHYNTASATGVIVTAVPFTATVATANATTCKTAVLPVGAGTGTCTISVSAGPVLINSIHMQMWDSTGKTSLYQAVLPVSYQVGGGANYVSGISFSPESPNVVVIGKGVSVKFSYRTNQAGGVRIIAMPFTGTAVTANAVTCGSTIYTGSGLGTCRFAVASGAVNVTSVHIQIWDAGHVNMLAQQILPVAYRFRSGPTMLTHVTVGQSANIYRLGNKVTLHFDYATNESAGILVVATPFTGAAATAGATIGASALLPVGTGKGSSFFVVSGLPTNVTAIQFQVWNSTKTTLLFGFFVPVYYQIQ